MFIANAMDLAMVKAAERDRELIRYPAAECARLREPDVMGLARLPPADHARLTGNKAQMVFVTPAPGLHRGTVGADPGPQT